jgi:geranylgeranyl reductase
MTEQKAIVYDVVVIGGGPAGATAATDLARKGYQVLLLERGDRIKPCGGAIPPQAMLEFEIPEEWLVAKINSARMVAPSDRFVDMPIQGGYVGMVDRRSFDVKLRERAVAAGVLLQQGFFTGLSEQGDVVTIRYRAMNNTDGSKAQDETIIQAKAVIGADGARSAVARQCIPKAQDLPHVAAYHEIIRTPPPDQQDNYDPTRCDVYYQGRLSPDFYAWIFPHGDTISIGVGTEQKGFSLRQAVTQLRRDTGLDQCETLRREGAPIPLYPLPRWDNGRNVVLAGDAAGVVAPASGEGIYYALLGGRLAADAVAEFLNTGRAQALATARKRFMKAHGRVFWILGIMQRFWYKTDRRRERFVSICADPDVQHLTWEAYMYKRLVKAKPLAHIRIFFKDMAHLLGLVTPWRKSN